MTSSTLALAMLAALAVLALVVMVSGSLRVRGRMKRRMAPLADLLDADDALPAVVPTGKTARQKTPLLAMLERRYPLAGGLRAGGAAAASGVFGALALAPALAFFGMPLVVAVLFGVLLGVGLGISVGSFLEQRKRLQFNDRLLVAVDEFQRLARYGVSTGQAFKSVAASAVEPVADSLRRVALDADLGVSLGDGLGREAHRVRISEMAMLAAILSTQSRSGGGLSESIGNLADMLRERNDNLARSRAATSESKISLIILSCVPFAAIGIQAGLQPDLVDTLLNDARYLLGIGVGLIAAGLVVAWFMVRSAGR